ncbi:Pycsar system effector family protein [Pedobacter duraquae]|uniref:Putative metal-dependent HD superfamily phosphohydrolase n=1 Tax=Pedobacter duraquae TaxID=425511 RepID=A0A4R6IL15_9SPHI|nr:Pycsar system effector family protein [Pedobacter duraquae]TDO22804.1 putative metal-dependent HD superfamily phosphohydrolase [Pedobacter duraquae]
MNFLEILGQVKTHVEALFKADHQKKLVYHNVVHTEHVAKHAVELANFYRLNDRDLFIVVAASWFHDIGYMEKWEQHELRGADAAAIYLTDKGVDADTVQEVKDCIMATMMPQNPKNLLQQIICDSDLYHLGSDDFKDRNKMMRQETENLLGKSIDKSVWRMGTIKLMESHHYHTQYCQDKLNAKKQINLDDLKSKVKKELSGKEIERLQGVERIEGTDNIPDTPRVEYTISVQATPDNMLNNSGAGIAIADNGAKGKKGKKNKDRPDKGIETMFRISSGNHQRLSDMADNKAHIMISTNSIILSVILSILLRKLEDNPHLIAPTLLLLIICVVTMVFSILATRPSVPPGTFTPEEIANKSTNLLFFGNFYRMGLPEYDAGIHKMMEDREFLYGSLIKDVYSQGVVLGRKYRLLRIAYNVFMFGIVASVLAFIIAMAFSM